MIMKIEYLPHLHKVAHGEVPVRRCSLREKDRVVEADRLIPGNPLRMVMVRLRRRIRTMIKDLDFIAVWMLCDR